MVFPPHSPEKDKLVTHPGPARRGLVTEADAAPTAAARRALAEPLVEESLDDTLSLVDLGFRRRVRLTRRAIAPAAVIAAVLVATTAAFAASLPGVATGDPYITATPAIATPAAARETAISRLSIRTPIATATASGTTARATASATPKAATSSASAKQTAKATATPTRKPLAAVTGTRYATVALNVRAAASTSAAKVASLGVGDKVSIVGSSVDGWQRVRVNGSDAWAKASFLSKTKPAGQAASCLLYTSPSPRE